MNDIYYNISSIYFYFLFLYYINIQLFKLYISCELKIKILKV